MKNIVVFTYRTGQYAPDPKDSTMRRLLQLCEAAGAKTKGSTRHFTAEYMGTTFVFTEDDK